jgi:hypothetical protein
MLAATFDFVAHAGAQVLQASFADPMVQSWLSAITVWLMLCMHKGIANHLTGAPSGAVLVRAAAAVAAAPQPEAVVAEGEAAPAAQKDRVCTVQHSTTNLAYTKALLLVN